MDNQVSVASAPTTPSRRIVEPEAPLSRLPLVVSAALAATFGLLSAGLLLAMAGLHHAALQAPVAVIIAVALYRLLPSQRLEPQLSGAIVTALTVAVLIIVSSNFILRSDLVIAGRDGGTYANTASFLVEGSNLFPVAAEEPFIGSDLEISGPGFVAKPDGTFYQQFLHATPATYAFFGELFGKGALFNVNALLSGVAALAIFALALRFVAAWWAMLAMVATALTLPFAYYSRGTFSEIATLTLTVGGLWAAHIALSGHRRVALGAGILLGGAAIVRVDAWFIGIALAALVFTTTWLEEEEATEAAARIYGGFAVVAAVGLIDLVFFSEPYLANVGKRLLPLIVVTIGLRVAAPLASGDRMRQMATWVKQHQNAVGNGLALAVLAVVGYLWFVRPLLTPLLAEAAYGLEPIQLAEGNPVEPNRSYAELSVRWLTWYLGIPVVLVGFLGLAAAVRHSTARHAAALRLVTLAFLVPAVTYLVKPAVNPDQIWAIRRYLPAVIPGLAIFAVAMLAWAVSLIPQRRWTPLVAIGISVAAIAPLLAASAPLLLETDRADLESQFSGLCTALGDAESVLLISQEGVTPLTWNVGPPLRSWCGVSIAGTMEGTAIAIPVDAVIAADPALLPGEADVFYKLESDTWESRLTAAPETTIRRSLDFYISFPDS